MEGSAYKISVHAAVERCIAGNQVVIATLNDFLTIGIEGCNNQHDLMCLIKCMHIDSEIIQLLDEELWGIVTTFNGRALILRRRGNAGDFSINGKRSKNGVFAIAPEGQDMQMHRLDIWINKEDKPTTVFIRFHKAS